MAGQFDPYHKWLGISPEKQPPNLYQLLGVDDFESDPDVIESAADQRMAHLRKFQSGKHGKLSQQLLNEVSAARVTLLNADKKSAYDEQMRAGLAGADDPLGPSFDQLGGGTTLPDFGSPAARPTSELAAPVVSTKPAVRKRPAWILPAGISIGAVAILAVVIAVIVGRLDKDDPSNRVAEQKPPGPNDRPDNAPSNDEPADGEDDSANGEKNPSNDPDADTPGNEKTGDHPPGTSNDDSSNPFEAIDDAPPDADSSAPETTNDATTGPVEPATEAQQKHPLPSEEQQKPVFATLQETFDLSKQRSSQEQLKLAADFLKLADETTDPIEKFVLLRATTSLAGEGGDALLLLQAVDSIDRHFEINRLDIGQKALLGFANSASTEQAFGSLVDASATFIEDAIAEDRIDVANQLAEAVYDRMVKSSVAAKFRKQAYDQRNRLNKMFAQWKKIQAALAKLEKEPDDPDANLLLGTWHCFEKQDWETGLPYLAKSSHKPLSTLASREMDSPPQSTDEFIALADAWWDAAEANDVKNVYKEDIQRRAGYWYEAAEHEGVQGIQQVKVEQRLEKLKPLAPFSVVRQQSDSKSQGDATSTDTKAADPIGDWVDLVALVDPKEHGKGGTWTKSQDSITVSGKDSFLRIPYDPGGSYDLHLEFLRHADAVMGMTIPVTDYQAQLVVGFEIFYENRPTLDRLNSVGGEVPQRKSVIENGRPYAFDIAVRTKGDDTAIYVRLNGVDYIYSQGKVSSLNIRGDPTMRPNSSGLGLKVKPTAEGVTFRNIRVRKVSPDAPIL